MMDQLPAEDSRCSLKPLIAKVPEKPAARRWLPPYLRRMLDLEIGQSENIYPEVGDELEALWKRLRRQSARYQKTGHYFHLHHRTDHIFVQRVDKGSQGKLAPFLRMAVGQKLLCKEPFYTKEDQMRIRRRLNYLAQQRGTFVWLEQHRNGDLQYRCYSNRVADVVWNENLDDDGSDFINVKIVCAPFEIRTSQEELRSITTAIMKKRKAANDSSDLYR